MKRVQKKENRTRSELLREAWRQYFESHYGSYTPPKAELVAMRAGRSQISQGEFRTLQEILNDVDLTRRKPAEKQLVKVPVKSRPLLLAAFVEMQQNPFSGDIRRLASAHST